MIPQEAIEEEALRRYDGDIDGQTGASIDDWGYSECERRAFVAGALFASTEAAAAELEAAADGWQAHILAMNWGTTYPIKWLRARAAAIRDGAS